MAVKVHEFFAHQRRSSLAFTLLASIAGTLLGATAAWALFWYFPLGPVFTPIAAIATLLLCNIAFTLWALGNATAPLRVLSQAIAHVSKDPVVTPPPDVSHRHDEQSGLRAMVQTVFELAALTGNTTPSTTDTTASSALAQQLLADMPCGVMALSGGKVTYANPAAPVTQKSDGSYELNLIFAKSDTLSAWLADCITNKVRDTHTWLRITDKLPGEANLRTFDVAAYYQKEHPLGLDAIVVTFDRSVAYSPEEEDMSFIAMAAHELRGPITVIRGYVDELQQELAPQLPDDQKQLFERLQVSSERLSAYVNNIMDVSRFERQQLTINRQEDNIADIIDSVLPDLTLRATTQNRRLQVQIPQGLPTVAADRSSLSEVIANLTDNAIKYSREGGEVTIKAGTKEDMVELTVTDQGIGIPGSIMGNLFTRFYRSHRSRQQVGGMGLGLYICKAIVETHGGSIWVSSVEGKGSTFGFTLPTYASVADKLKSGDNQVSTQRSGGWIKNHAMYRR